MPQILLIEDDEHVREALDIALRHYGHEVRVRGDGESGIAAVREREPDVMVLDVTLPGAAGFETCRRLRAFSAVPVVMLTARTDDVDVVAGLEAGADDHLAKPVQPRVLDAKLKAVLRRVPLATASPPSGPVAFGDLVLDRGSPVVTRRGKHSTSRPWSCGCCSSCRPTPAWSCRASSCSRRCGGRTTSATRAWSTPAVTDVLAAHADGMSADAGRATHLVVQEIAHLDRLVGDLIEISRFDAGTAVLDAERVDVAAAVARTLTVRGWRDQVHVDADAGLTAHLDLRRFDVVVANLVGNALKYGAPPVVVTARPHRDGLVVEVTDRGPGIPEQALPHLFARFYKADAARARSDGSGLGLAIALENARLHGGDLQAGNRPDGGAVLRLTMPGAPDPGTAARP